MLEDKDRIFQNLYGFGDWGLAGARARGGWDNTKGLIEKGKDWIIEGHGVDPDIEVEQDPLAVLQGHDPQLERGVQELMKLLPATPAGLPQRPAPPVKTEAH